MSVAPNLLGAPNSPSPLRARCLFSILTLTAFHGCGFWNETHLLRNLRVDIDTEGVAVHNAHRISSTDDVVPLPLLTRSSAAAATSCPPGFVPVLDTVLPTAVTHPPSRRIPKVVHVTSRSRCVTAGVRDHLEQWRRTANHSFFFHDDAAVRRLLGQGWVDRTFRTGRRTNETCPGTAKLPPGPYARKDGCSWEHSYLPDRSASAVALKCATAGATMADLWRYAVLYRYGGIYTDLDNSKGEKWRDDLIKDDDDFVGTVEVLGIIGQYWLASSPGHPYLRHTMDDALSHLRVSPEVMINQPERNTGPGAAKRGFCFFLEAGRGRAAGDTLAGGYVEAGKYVGDQNRSVTVIGRAGRREQREYVDRFGLGKEKATYYEAANMTHFLKQTELRRSGLISTMPSCEDHLKRTEGQPEKKANYVYDAATRKYVDTPSDIL